MGKWIKLKNARCHKECKAQLLNLDAIELILMIETKDEFKILLSEIRDSDKKNIIVEVYNNSVELIQRFDEIRSCLDV